MTKNGGIKTKIEAKTAVYSESGTELNGADFFFFFLRLTYNNLQNCNPQKKIKLWW